MKIRINGTEHEVPVSADGTLDLSTLQTLLTETEILNIRNVVSLEKLKESLEKIQKDVVDNLWFQWLPDSTRERLEILINKITREINNYANARNPREFYSAQQCIREAVSALKGSAVASQALNDFLTDANFSVLPPPDEITHAAARIAFNARKSHDSKFYFDYIEDYRKPEKAIEAKEKVVTYYHQKKRTFWQWMSSFWSSPIPVAVSTGINFRSDGTGGKVLDLTDATTSLIDDEKTFLRVLDEVQITAIKDYMPMPDKIEHVKELTSKRILIEERVLDKLQEQARKNYIAKLTADWGDIGSGTEVGKAVYHIYYEYLVAHQRELGFELPENIALITADQSTQLYHYFTKNRPAIEKWYIGHKAENYDQRWTDAVYIALSRRLASTEMTTNAVSSLGRVFNPGHCVTNEALNNVLMPYEAFNIRKRFLPEIQQQLRTNNYLTAVNNAIMNSQSAFRQLMYDKFIASDLAKNTLNSFRLRACIENVYNENQYVELLQSVTKSNVTIVEELETLLITDLFNTGFFQPMLDDTPLMPENPTESEERKVKQEQTASLMLTQALTGGGQNAPSLGVQIREGGQNLYDPKARLAENFFIIGDENNALLDGWMDGDENFFSLPLTRVDNAMHAIHDAASSTRNVFGQWSSGSKRSTSGESNNSLNDRSTTPSPSSLTTTESNSTESLDPKATLTGSDYCGILQSLPPPTVVVTSRSRSESLGSTGTDSSIESADDSESDLLLKHNKNIILEVVDSGEGTRNLFDY